MTKTKFKKFASVALAGISCLSLAVFAGCDTDTGESGNNGGNNNGNNTTQVTAAELYEAAVNSAIDIATTTTGYEISANVVFGYYYAADYGMSGNFSADMKYANGTSTNADLTLSGGITETEDGESENEYAYMSMLLRDSDVYLGVLSSDQTITDYSDMLYQKETVDLSDYLSDYGIDLSTLNLTSSSISLLLNSVSPVTDLIYSLAGNFGASVTSSSSGYRLDVDIAGTVNSILNSAETIVTYLSTCNLSTTTVGDLLGNAAVKSVINTYLAGITGEDIYNAVDTVYGLLSLMNSSDSSLLSAASGTASDALDGLLPAATSGQSAYDYLCSVVTYYELDGYTLEYLDLTAENFAEALEEIDYMQAIFNGVTLEYSLTFNTSKELTGLDITVANLLMDDGTLTLTANVTFEEKAVTFATTPAEYYEEAIYGISTEGLISGTNDDVAVIYLTNAGNAYVYLYNEAGMPYNSGVSGTYTCSTAGDYDTAVITIDDTQYSASDTFTLTINSVTYTFGLGI